MHKTIINFKEFNEVSIPSSKSIVIRSLLIKYLLNSQKKLIYQNSCDDVKYTEGVTLDLTKKANKLTIGESATLLRLLIPNIIDQDKLQLELSGTLINRDIKYYQDLYHDYGIKLNKEGNLITIDNPKRIKPNFDNLKIDEVNSSQFVSGILIYQAINHLNSQISINLNLNSLSYVFLTIDCLKKFGFEFESQLVDNCLIIKIVNYTKNNEDLVIERDASTASLMGLMGLINRPITIKDYFNKTIEQPDDAFIDLLDLIDANFEQDNFDLVIKPSMISADILVSVKNNPDLAIVLMIIGCINKGKTEICDFDNLIYKESNRIKAMEEELNKINVKFIYRDNSLIIDNSQMAYDGKDFLSHSDHRIAMALMILSSVLEGTSTIDDIECINKSYPEFKNYLK